MKYGHITSVSSLSVSNKCYYFYRNYFGPGCDSGSTWFSACACHCSSHLLRALCSK